MDTESPPPVPDLTAIDSIANGSNHQLHMNHHLSHHTLKQSQLFQSYLHSQSSNSSSSIASNGGNSSNNNNNNTSSSASSNSNSASNMRNNEVRSVMLHGVPIVALIMDNAERLCLAQISNTLLKNFSYNEIHNRRVALGITCVQCTPVQLELLRRAGAMPVSSRRCGMITKREAERLCKSFLSETAPPKLPDSFSFEVYHHCAWGCRGAFNPSRYNSSRAKCIKCCFCGLFFSPNKFIFHSHRLPDSKYVQPDAANFNSWRRHIKLSGSQPEEVLYAWEDVKAMFNGGSRKRAMAASLTSVSKQQQHRRQQNHQAQQAAHQQNQQQQQQQQQSNEHNGGSVSTAASLGGRQSPLISPAINFTSLPSQGGGGKRCRLSPQSPEVGLTAIQLDKGSPTSVTNTNAGNGSGGSIPISPVSAFTLGLSESHQQQQQANLHNSNHLAHHTQASSLNHHQQSPHSRSPPTNASQLHLLNATSSSLNHHHHSSSNNGNSAHTGNNSSHLASVLANASAYPFPLISLAASKGLAGLTGARSSISPPLFTPPHPPAIHGNHFSLPGPSSGTVNCGNSGTNSNSVTGSPIHPSNLLASKSPGANSTSATSPSNLTGPDIRASFAEFLGQSWAWAAAAAAAGKSHQSSSSSSSSSSCNTGLAASASSASAASSPLLSPFHNYLFWPRPPIDSLRQVHPSPAATQRAFASVSLPTLSASDLTSDHQVSPFFSPSSLMEKAVAAWEREINSQRKSPIHPVSTSVSLSNRTDASDVRCEKRVDHLISTSSSAQHSSGNTSSSAHSSPGNGHTSAFKPVSGVMASKPSKSILNINVQGGNSSSFRAENLMISDQINDNVSRNIHLCNGSIDSASDQDNSRSPLNPPSSRDELEDDEDDDNEVDIIGEAHGDSESQNTCEESHLE